MKFTIGIISLAILVNLAPAETCDTKNHTLLSKCDSALSACQDLVKEEDQAIKNLKDGQKQLEDKLAEDVAPLVPWYAWAGAGLVGGLILGLKVGK